jgi:hypothetical protein
MSIMLQHDRELAEYIAEEYYRMEPFLRDAIYAFVERRFSQNAPAFLLGDGRSKIFFVGFYNFPDVRPLLCLAV